MSRVTVLVTCLRCEDGSTADGLVCGWCNGLGHEAVNRTPEGGVPTGRTEWCPPLLPPLPDRED